MYIIPKYYHAGVAGIIQEQTAEERQKRQERIKREKETQQKAVAAGHRLRMKAFSKKEENIGENVMSTVRFGKTWGKRTDISKSNKLGDLDKEEEKKVIPLSEKLRLARGPYNAQDPLAVCHSNDRCHQRNHSAERCGLHKLNKEEVKAKQKVRLKS